MTNPKGHITPLTYKVVSSTAPTNLNTDHPGQQSISPTSFPSKTRLYLECDIYVFHVRQKNSEKKTVLYTRSVYTLKSFQNLEHSNHSIYTLVTIPQCNVSQFIEPKIAVQFYSGKQNHDFLSVQNLNLICLLSIAYTTRSSE